MTSVPSGLERLYKNEYERTKEIVGLPDWYLAFGTLRRLRMTGLAAVQSAFQGNVAEASYYSRHQTIDIFEQLLEEQAVRLGRPGEEQLDDQDEGRLPVSQLVIHHSARAEGISLASLNALQLLSLYVPVYRNKDRPVLNDNGDLQPIYSGHFDDDGKQVFYGYHWKVQQNGDAARLLPDSALAWHAGNWEVNKRSIGICIDDNLEHSDPTPASLDAVAEIIRTHYSDLPAQEAIVGHNQVTLLETACPGDRFAEGWKRELIKLVQRP